MGGAGSGQQGGRPVVDDCRSLDVARLHRDGCLRPGWSGTIHWSRDGEVVASLGAWATEGRLTLTYRYRRNEEEWQDVEEPVPIASTPCHFGGSRPWFVCPGMVDGVSCGRRVAKLYGPGRYFLCRHCYGLAYQSQREQFHERAFRRANGIRMRLGGEPGMLCPFPEKPNGMHSRTYEGLRERARDAEMVAEEHLWAVLGRIRAGSGEPSRKGSKEFWS
jgi:hypothetical protein